MIKTAKNVTPNTTNMSSHINWASPESFKANIFAIPNEKKLIIMYEIGISRLFKNLVPLISINKYIMLMDKTSKGTKILMIRQVNFCIWNQ